MTTHAHFAPTLMAECGLVSAVHCSRGHPWVWALFRPLSPRCRRLRSPSIQIDRTGRPRASKQWRPAALCPSRRQQRGTWRRGRRHSRATIMRIVSIDRSAGRRAGRGSMALENGRIVHRTLYYISAFGLRGSVLLL